jgi:hypothetical protein
MLLISGTKVSQLYYNKFHLVLGHRFCTSTGSIQAPFSADAVFV